ncbi:MAG: cysteine--tRNA ligase [Candidatus Pacearchaeota archaeon]
MVIKLYNTLTRKKETFKPIKKGEVGIYECGPTVYSAPHIGNLRRYIFGDILTRVFLFNDYKVKRVMNVTDVGHLTSDSDEGEDKIEKASQKEGKTAEEISNYYWNIFKEDFKRLNILEPNIWCKATEHIKEQIELIKKLEEKGFTYGTNDGIYFDTSKLTTYGKLAKLDLKGIEEGKRIDLKEKKNKTDFALWKFSSSQEGKRQQEWGSPWGVGFPGWHIECSAMSMKYLGEIFDIHTGGIDNMFPHHENEIAQSETATGKKFVNYWLHCGFLTFKGEKVSKSKGGLYTLSELEEKGFKPIYYRYLCLNTNYRKPLEFSIETLENSANAYNRLRNIIKEMGKEGKVEKAYIDKFKKEINNDLNTPKAIAVLWELIRDEKIPQENKRKTIEKMDKVLGLELLKEEILEIPKEVEKLAKERQKAREEKDWTKSDKIRDKINELGWNIKDTKEGYEIKRI